jgi:hypothetical protein
LRPSPPSLHLPQLKRRARELQRSQGLARCAALDHIAREHGYVSWSLLAAKAGPQPSRRAAGAGPLLQRLRPGESLLLGSRPGQGKTARAIALVSHVLRRGLPCWFFSLANDPTDVAALFTASGEPYPSPSGAFAFHHSDELCAARILEHLHGQVAPRSLIVVDYLQLLDQRRSAPELQQQVEQLTAFARQSGCSFVFLSQLRSELDAQRRAPRPSDVRLPNPLDLRLFDRLLLLQGGEARWHVAR